MTGLAGSGIVLASNSASRKAMLNAAGIAFEAQAADHKSSSRGGVAKLGLATTQGSVEGIKLYAATHAAKEGAPITGLIICSR